VLIDRLNATTGATLIHSLTNNTLVLSFACAAGVVGIGLEERKVKKEPTVSQSDDQKYVKC